MYTSAYSPFTVYEECLIYVVVHINTNETASAHYLKNLHSKHYLVVCHSFSLHCLVSAEILAYSPH